LWLLLLVVVGPVMFMTMLLVVLGPEMFMTKLVGEASEGAGAVVGGAKRRASEGGWGG
jgi:hypothetical protein